MNENHIENKSMEEQKLITNEHARCEHLITGAAMHSHLHAIN